MTKWLETYCDRGRMTDLQCRVNKTKIKKYIYFKCEKMCAPYLKIEWICVDAVGIEWVDSERWPADTQ